MGPVELVPGQLGMGWTDVHLVGPILGPECYGGPGLDIHERNSIQTALRAHYDLQKVAAELRAQWPEICVCLALPGTM